MALILRHQRTQQPQQAVAVDRDNPFGRRAISAWLPVSAAGVDVARGSDNPQTDPAGYTVGEHGVALAYPGGSLDAAAQRPRLLTQSLPSTTDITIVLAARYYGDGARVFACSTVEAIPTSATAFDIYVSGVKRFTATFAGGCRKCLVVAYRTNTPTVDPVVYADGLPATITKSGTASSVSVSGNFAIGNHHSLVRQLHADIYGAALLGMVVSPAEAKSLSENPWQLFAPTPRRIWVPVASGGSPDVDEALSGQGVSTAAGSVSVAISAPLSGAASTASAGAAGALLSQELSGASASSAAGSVGAALSVALSGQSVSVTQGVVTEEGDAGAVLSGATASTAQGAAVSAVSQALSGEEATTAAGTLANSVTQALSGLALAVEQGNVEGAATGNVTAALLGVSLGVSLGDVTAQGGQLVRPPSTGGYRYYADIGGKRIHGTLEEIRRLVLQIAEEDAEETVEQAVPPKPAAIQIKAGRAVKRAMAKAAPEVAKQEVEQARESMQDAYQRAYRAAVSELAARRMEEDEEEAMLLLL